ncbi:MAG: DNA cytosine methyltransferase, partial [Candidatus Fonsibacter sp.]
RVATYVGGAWWQARVAELESMDYHVQWSILNAAHHGVPQNRPRLWVVGIRKDCPGQPGSFRMPEALPPALRLSLADILAPRTAAEDPEALPRAKGARENVQ